MLVKIVINRIYKSQTKGLKKKPESKHDEENTTVIATSTLIDVMQFMRRLYCPLSEQSRADFDQFPFQHLCFHSGTSTQ